MYRWFILLCLLVLVKWTVASDLELLILHNNDMHARFEETSKSSGTCPAKKQQLGLCYGGFARVAHAVRAAREDARRGTGPQVLFLNAGDTYTGTAWFSIHRWRIVAEFLNILKPDAASLGNHEFDDGVQGLVPLLKNVSFPVLSCNLDLSKEPTLAATPLRPSTILNVENRQIGIIGYLTPETKIIARTEDVIFNDEIESIRKESEKLHAQGVKTIIALGHSGFEMDKKIAANVPLVDLVVGGHTNTFLYNGPQPDIEVPEGLYPTVITQKNGKKVPVVQAYAYTKYLGRLKIVIKEDGSLKSFEGQPLLLNSSIPQDKDVLDVLEKYRPEVIALDKQIVGNTKVVLESNNCRMEECNFGNLIADAFVAFKASEYHGDYWTDAAIGLQNGGGIRITVDARHKGGNVTRGDLLAALPFDNLMSVVSLIGTDLLQVLETSVRSNGETSRGEFLQFSGLQAEYDLSKPVGSRVISAKVRCAACVVPTYEEIDPNKEYRVIVTQFLLSGGDGFNVLKEKAFKVEPLEISDLDTVAWYLNKFSPVFPEISSKISVQSGAIQIIATLFHVVLPLIIFTFVR